MSAQVIDITAHPNGRRYSPVDREAAYLHWKTLSGRSLRKSAESLGISASTLGTWHQEDGWKKRAIDEDREDIQSMHASTRMLFVGDLHTNITVAREIRDNKSAADRDRLDALKWLSGCAGVAPVSKVEQAFINQPYQGGDVEEQPDFERMTTEELREYESRVKRKKRSA